jgi:glycosyltransferase 2 family protein
LKALRWGVALALSVGGLWFALRGVDLKSIGEAVRNVRQPGWLAVWSVLMFVEFSLRSVRWRFLLPAENRRPFFTIFPITAGGFFLNMILPFRAGELARVYWTNQRCGVPFTGAVAVFVGDRLMDMLALLTLIGWVLVRKAALIESTAAILFFAGAGIGGLSLVVLTARYPDYFRAKIQGSRFPRRLKEWLGQFLTGTSVLGSVRHLLFLYAVSLAFWSLNVTYVSRVAPLFGVDLSWTDTAFLFVAFSFGAALPSAPGFVGTFEAAGVAALQLIGYGRETALPLVLTTHAFMIGNVALWGIPSLLLSGLRFERNAPPK